MQKPLTKSRFKLGLECPNKLFFTSDSSFVNTQIEDTFLQSLAEGGFQVEELARLSYPKGVFIEAEHYAYQQALDQTQQHFSNSDTTLFEAAFGHGQLFVRTDIVVKKGNHVRLIEVKAKSFDPDDEHVFVGKRGGIVSKWLHYLADIAYQKYVAQLNYPELEFSTYLMMADKSKKATIDGLNQLFRIPKQGDPRKDLIRQVQSLDEIGGTVLSELNMDALMESIFQEEGLLLEGKTFEEAVHYLRDIYTQKQYAFAPLKYSVCRKCEFTATKDELAAGKKSGLRYCFQKQLGWTDQDFEKVLITKIGNSFAGKKFFEEGRYTCCSLTEQDFTDKKNVMTPQLERQWFQVDKLQRGDTSIHVYKEGLRDEMAQWQFPLHFIDFETSMVALPFVRGRRPYEQTAFQFSHHIVYEDQRIVHFNEFLHADAGEFPNFEFARALKNSLSAFPGSIFRYSIHENTIVNALIEQLRDSDAPDRNELIDFLKSISQSKKDSAEKWVGERNMIDLCEVAKQFYFNPYANGSNSIKYILPAVIKSSPFLQQKYAQPLSALGMSSHNFPPDHVWLPPSNDGVVNPYACLPPLFDGWTEEALASLISEMEDVKDGGAALTAYAKLQYEDMEDAEREEIKRGLLKYCELDTLAMVMIYEHFREVVIK